MLHSNPTWFNNCNFATTKTNAMRIIQSFSLFSLLILAFSSTAQYDNQRIVSSYYEFEEGSTELLYSDKVVFRAGPTSSAKGIDTLEIGTEIEIVRRTEETSSLNGLDWNWYKVKVGRKTGYILGGLIALDQIRYDDCLYLVTVAGVDQSYNGYDYQTYKVRVRVIIANNDFYGHEADLNTNSFYIEAFGNRGLEGVDNMLRINLFAESCGTDGGEIYLFNTDSKLIEGISLSAVSDAGAFWYTESVKFPEDEGGWDGAVHYEREQGEYINEDMNWTKATIHSLTLKWENGQFTPNIKEFEFGEDE